MPQYRRTMVLLGIILSAVLVAAFPLTVSADINSYPSPSLGTTHTNPSDPNGVGVWRQGWGTSLFPDFNLTLPAGTSSQTYPQVRGIIYTVDRSLFTQVDYLNPAGYDHAIDPNGTSLDHTLDMPGILASNPVGFASTDPAARLPIEGYWFLHYSFYDVSQVSTLTLTAGFGIDLTPPLPISKMTVKPYLGYAGPTGIWNVDKRAVVAWEEKEYDALSGVAAYEIWVNGERLEFAEDDPMYKYHLGHTFTTFTLESLEEGENEITVKTVDRAANVGPGVSAKYLVDSAPPVLKITKPVVGGYVGKTGLFEATATDGAGIQSVRFYIDGGLVHTDTQAPYGLSKDMSAYATGAHQLKVIAKDMLGREVTALRDFTLDKTPALLTSISDSPDPFYPVLLDGYRDISTVNFWTNEQVYAYVYYYRSSGGMFTGRSGARASGWNQFKWNGRDLEGTVGLGTYSYRVVLVDRAGNQTASTWQTTTIRDYELVRVAGNAVMVIPR